MYETACLFSGEIVLSTFVMFSKSVFLVDMYGSVLGPHLLICNTFFSEIYTFVNLLFL